VNGADFTCLIPAYNEAARIGGVLDAVLGHPLLAEVVVVDDGSTDGTADLVRGRGARVIRTPGNLGKTKALALGLRGVRTSHVVLIDADLIGLTPATVTALIAPVAEGRAVATVSLRGNAPRTWRMIGIDYISGERVFPVALVQGRDAELQALPRFGFEVFLNDLLIMGKSAVAIVHWPDVASPSKASKRGFWAGIWADAAMMGDIFRTVGMVACLRQIVAMRRLRVPA
jgi:glycosyltransferase involved in cell wall biosynthesis